MILSLMIRDNTNLCQCTGPASQIPIRVTAPPVKKKKTISYSDKALMTFYDDALDMNYLEFLVHALSITSHHS